MKRHLLNLLTVLSLVLCVAVVVLWVRSSRVRDRAGWGFDSYAVWCYSGGGRVSVAWASVPPGRGSFGAPNGGKHYERTIRRSGHDDLMRRLMYSLSDDFGVPPPTDVGLLGVRFARSSPTMTGWSIGQIGPVGWYPQRGASPPVMVTLTSVTVPCGMLALLMSFLPVRSSLLLLRRRHRRMTPAANLCTQCGYDLRATPDKCPECGESSRRSGG